MIENYEKMEMLLLHIHYFDNLQLSESSFFLNH